MDLVTQASDGKTYSINLGDSNLNLVKKKIIEREHPHPMLFSLIVVVILLLIYYIYVTGIKRSFTGEWYTDDYTIYIFHNKWTDTLNIRLCEDDKPDKDFNGKSVGNALYITSEDKDDSTVLKGVYFDDSIIWTYGPVWKKSI